MKQGVETRRRGTALEAAILDAAWAVLVAGGYGAFTMDAVAKRAGTSRPVLARRWDSRSELAVAAIGHYHRSHPVEAPDLGSLRDELVALLAALSDRGAMMMNALVINMNAYFEETDTTLADLRQRIIGGEDSRMTELVARGIRRGELDPKKLTPRLAALPADLVRHEILMTHKPVPRAAIEEIVDTIFLPLVAAREPR